MRWRLPLLQPGPILQDQRRLLRRIIGPQGLPKHQYLITSEIHNLLCDLNGFKGEPSRRVAKYVLCLYNCTSLITGTLKPNGRYCHTTNLWKGYVDRKGPGTRGTQHGSHAAGCTCIHEIVARRLFPLEYVVLSRHTNQGLEY